MSGVVGTKRQPKDFEAFLAPTRATVS